MTVSSQLSRPSPHVLIVDDSEDATEMLGILLEMRACTTARAHSGTEALARFDHERPDLVLLDIGLPDIDGVALAAQLRARSAHVMLVALTGRSDAETQQAARRAGCAQLLTKPVDWSELDRILEAASRA